MGSRRRSRIVSAAPRPRPSYTPSANRLGATRTTARWPPGRPGRAVNKGTAILVVPYPLRKRVESVLRGARIVAEWIRPPMPEDIRRNNHQRLLAALLEPVEIDEADR